MKKYIGLVLVAMSGCILTVNAQQSFSYKNPLLPTELRVNDLLGRMTLEEKIAQIRHLHSWDVFDGQILNQEKLFPGSLTSASPSSFKTVSKFRFAGCTSSHT